MMERKEAEPLSQSELSAFKARGWLSARGFFSPEEAHEISRMTDELRSAPEVPGRHMVYYEDSLTKPGERIVQRIENFCPFHTGFDALVRGGRLQAAVDQLLDGETCLFKEKINFKLPGGGSFEAHQDQQAGWSTYAPMFVTALVCIDEASVENGCLEMADCPRLERMIGEEWKPLTPDNMTGMSLNPVETKPGDVLFFDSYVPHASKPNFTDSQRRILYLTYNRLADGDHRVRYFADKRANFPPDVERAPGATYKFRV
jgi:hypothetical protein